MQCKLGLEAVQVDIRYRVNGAFTLLNRWLRGICIEAPTLMPAWHSVKLKPDSCRCQQSPAGLTGYLCLFTGWQIL